MSFSKEFALEINNLSFSYDAKRPIFQHFNLNIPAHSYVAIIGENGSGKSTLFRLVMGLLEPKEGEIKIAGLTLNLQNITKIRRHITAILQNPDNQFVGTTVRDDIAFGLENQQCSRADMIFKINTCAKLFHIENLLDQGPMQLSGGQKQKVAIAGAFALGADIIFFDESLSMVDPQTKSEVRTLMKNLQVAEHKTILSITHDMEELFHATHILILHHGKLIQFASRDEVLAQPQELLKYNVEVPMLLRTALQLKQKFPTFPVNIFSKTQFVENIWKLFCKT